VTTVTPVDEVCRYPRGAIATGQRAMGSSRCTVRPGASRPSRRAPVEPTTSTAAPTSSAYSVSTSATEPGPSAANTGSLSPQPSPMMARALANLARATFWALGIQRGSLATAARPRASAG